MGVSLFQSVIHADPVAFAYAGVNTTVIVILMAYPLAYFIARAQPKRRNTFLFLVLIPLWTNFVIRVYAWMMLLRKEGAINLMIGTVAHWLHIPFQPLEMFYTPGAVLGRDGL